MTQPAGILTYDLDADSVTPAQNYLPAYLAWTDDAGDAQQFQCFVKSEDYDYGADVTDHPVETGSNVTDNVRVKRREAKIFFFESNTPIDSNNWASAAAATSIITIPSPPAQPPQAPLFFDSWNNLITEKALGASALGAVGNLAGATGGAIGTLAGEAIGSSIVGAGVPVPQVVPPSPTQPLAPPITVQSRVIGFGSAQDFVQLTIAQLELLLNNVQVVDLIAPKLVISTMVINSIHIHRDNDTGDAAEIEVGLKEIRFVSTTTVPAPAPTVVRTTPPVSKGEQGTSDAPAATTDVATQLLGLFGVHL